MVWLAEIMPTVQPQTLVGAEILDLTGSPFLGGWNMGPLLQAWHHGPLLPGIETDRHLDCERQSDQAAAIFVRRCSCFSTCSSRR